jgi:hypothetical protein
VQWDPERDLQLQALPYRAIQIGLSGEAVNLYVNTWTKSISDVTPLAHQIYALLQAGDTAAAALLPQEREYMPLYGENLQAVQSDSAGMSPACCPYRTSKIRRNHKHSLRLT